MGLHKWGWFTKSFSLHCPCFKVHVSKVVWYNYNLFYCAPTTVWKMQKFSLSPQCGNLGNFPPLREISLQYNSLVKKLVWRNFCKKIVGENLQISTSRCGNYGNSLSRIFGKNFVKATVLLKRLLKSWFDKIFLWWERISRFSTLCTLCSHTFFTKNPWKQWFSKEITK